MGKQTTELLETGYEELLFAARRSVRYHRHRERFLDRMHHLGSLLTTFGGSATITAFVAELPADWAWLLPTAALITALAGAHEVVFRTAQGARQHASLARDFVILEQDLLGAGSSLTSKTLVELQTRRLDIEATEPPVYRVLDATCHDELVTALGVESSQRTNVRWWQRVCRHLLDVAPHRIRKQAG